MRWVSCSCSGPGSFLTLQAKVAAGQAYAWLTGQSSWTAQTEAGREEAEGGSLASRAKNTEKAEREKEVWQMQTVCFPPLWGVESGREKEGKKEGGRKRRAHR